MKKYFAKYLPVEENIKKGDMVLCANGEKWKAAGDGGEADDKKCKLFLCSRDIQVGDEFVIVKENSCWGKVGEKAKLIWNGKSKCRVVGSNGLEHLVQADFDFIQSNNLCGIKVIGEISPEATWVKDGDEFDAKELQYPSICIRATAANDGNEKYRYPFTESDDQPYPDNPQKIQVKCPHCDHFH